ncbi:MAG: alpha/beta fold hydrolase [Pirellulales bacterium]
MAIICALAWALTAGGARADEEPKKPLPPEEVALRTRDGVLIQATYYPSTVGKESVPVILLHAEKGVRGDFASSALGLQALGHAVIAPDLRGHGDSPLPRAGERGAVLRPVDLADMVSQDVESVKNFLIERNNASELNIEKLCLVGAEMGAVVAVNFAARDWSWPVLATGKQGQDVKALVLISPEWSHRGLHITEAIEHPQVRTALSLIVIAGERSTKERRDAERLYKALERFRPAATPDDATGNRTLWLRMLPTTLQGTQLLNEARMGVQPMIEKFIELRLVNVDIPWQVRRNPLQ